MTPRPVDVADDSTAAVREVTDAAHSPVRFPSLLAGNLLAVGILALLFCAQFQGPAPLWLLQAPYFATGAVLALALTPLELLFLGRLRRHTPPAVVEAVLTAVASLPLGIPGGLLIGAIGALGPRSSVGAGLHGLGAYILLGGLVVAAVCFFCALIGRLLAALFVRVPWAGPVVFVLAALDLALAVVSPLLA